MNIDCEKIIEQLDDSEDEFASKFQNIMIMQEIKRFFGERLIGGIIKVYHNPF